MKKLILLIFLIPLVVNAQEKTISIATDYNVVYLELTSRDTIYHLVVSGDFNQIYLKCKDYFVKYDIVISGNRNQINYRNDVILSPGMNVNITISGDYNLIHFQEIFPFDNIKPLITITGYGNDIITERSRSYYNIKPYTPRKPNTPINIIINFMESEETRILHSEGSICMPDIITIYIPAKE